MCLYNNEQLYKHGIAATAWPNQKAAVTAHEGEINNGIKYKKNGYSYFNCIAHK